jgi:hypothetical protein
MNKLSLLCPPGLEGDYHTLTEEAQGDLSVEFLCDCLS